LFLASSLDAFFGTLSFLFVIGTRGGLQNLGKNMKGCWKQIGMVAMILFLFRFTQESSGFNRYMFPKDKIYKDLDNEQLNHMAQFEADKEATFYDQYKKILSEEQLQKKKTELRNKYSEDHANDDSVQMKNRFSPAFYLASGKTVTGLVSLLCLGGVMSLIYFAIRGYFGGTNSLSEYHVSYKQFVVELLAMGIINAIPSLIEPRIYGEKIGKSSISMAAGMGGMSAIVHVMFQYAGLYDSFLEQH
jgi:hypothetical protein